MPSMSALTNAQLSGSWEEHEKLQLTRSPHRLLRKAEGYCVRLCPLCAVTDRRGTKRSVPGRVCSTQPNLLRSESRQRPSTLQNVCPELWWAGCPFSMRNAPHLYMAEARYGTAHIRPGPGLSTCTIGQFLECDPGKHRAP